MTDNNNDARSVADPEQTTLADDNKDAVHDQMSLKRRRAAAKGVVTRLFSLVSQAVDQNRRQEAEERLNALDEALSRFIRAHEEYHRSLEDEDDIDISKAYLTSVLRDVQDLRHSVLSWLESSPIQPFDLDDELSVPNKSSSDNRLLAELQELRMMKQVEQQELSLLMSQKEELREQLKFKEAEVEEIRQRGETISTKNYSTPISRHPTLGLHPSLSSVREPSMSQLLELSRQQYQSHVDSMRLPPTDLIKFDGDPLIFWQFMRLFSTVVDKETVSDEEKLVRLIQYTTGQARDAISHCLYNPSPELGYADAMTILKKRFGNPYSISQAWVGKVLNYKDVKDNNQLQSFADTLRSCRDTLRSMKCEEELNGGRTLLQIIEKLPDDLKRMWLTKNFQITESGRRPKLDDIVDLVGTEAAKRSDPIFGNLLSRNASTNASPFPNKFNASKLKKRGAFATESFAENKLQSSSKNKTTSSLQCPKCSKGHFLNQCASFRGLSVQERLMFVQCKRLCQNCFMKGHTSSVCTRNWVCKVPGCGQRHNSWIHSAIVATTNNNNNNNRINQPPNQATRGETATDQLMVHTHATKESAEVRRSKIALPILPVVVSNPDNNFSMNVFALLDNGSNGTFCSKRLIHALKLKSRETDINLSTMETRDCKVRTLSVDLQVEDPLRQNRYLMKGVLCRDRLNISVDSLVNKEEVFNWPHLQDIASDICLPDVDLADEVHLLIGLDQPDILIPRELRRGELGEPYATLTGLGWTLNGPVSGGSGSLSAHFVQRDDALQEVVERFWKLEDSVHTDDNSLSVTDKMVLDLWENQVVKKDGHYVLPIPFKECPPQLPSNFVMAKHRLDSLAKRFKKDSSLHQKYSENIHDSLKKGYAEEVTNIDRKDGRVWYLPHHPVLHPRKPDKVRIVFDCAARYQGTSLNDRVHQGPDLTNNLLGVLLRFRQEPVALNADIESMFCQVKVPPEERDVLRFLWWEDNDPDKPPKHYRMTTHLFGGVWSPSAAAFALQRVTKTDCGDASSDTITTVERDFYVDDCLKSQPTEDAAITLAAELRELLARGGFKLTKWLSNSKKVMKSIPEEEWAKSLHELNIDRDDLPHERTLGVLWNVEKDCFTFDVTATDKQATKRGILSTTCSVYDPLGFASPFILRAKVLFQELCRRKMGWDENIPEDIAEQWNRWLADLPLLSSLTIPRCLKSSKSTSAVIQLHHFCDASELAYGGVSYIRIDKECKLVMAKSRLAPIKSTSIPRLELLAAVTATELDQFIKRHLEIPISETFFWTDSTIVLQYIKNKEHRFRTFVANRISKIHERSKPSEWRHVDSASNPADDVSRGMTASEILSSERWISGPTYLQHTEENWPVQPNVDALPEEAEIKRTKEVYATDLVTNHETTEAIDRLLQRYSSWHRLKRATAILLRLKALLSKKSSKQLLDPLTVDECRKAEVAILTYVQAASFGSARTKSSPIASLKPFQVGDSKLLRVGGRLTNAPIPYEAKHPIILPKNHHVSDLIIDHYHLRLGHAGPERVLAEIRQRYWILKGRTAVKRVLNSCLVCRKLKSTPQNQQMANLPGCRVTPNEPPFSRVGVDYFGPFTVKRARSELKRYGCLFTCLATRAIHLEVSNTLDTDSFINALQRFIARRGQPTEIRSDNGTNFVGGLRELRRAIGEWNHQKISDHLLLSDVKWIFNPPGASHMGGVWERQIRTVRSVLNTVLSRQALDDEGLATLFCCVEAIVNGRPLTKLSDDPLDPLPLTPNHLLLLRSGPILPPGAFEKQDLYRRRWRQVQYLADVFWSRWLKEYLPSLQQRQQWIQPTRNLQVGDLVLLLHENTPRNSWPLGLVTQVYPGTDGLVRAVQVKTCAGFFERSVDKICLLEANLGTNLP